MEQWKFFGLEGALKKSAEEIVAGWNISDTVEITANQGLETLGMQVRYTDGKAMITYGRPAAFFRGLGYVKQWIDEGKKGESIEETAAFPHLTYMIDCSRNAVVNMSFLKDMIRKMSLMGYDRCMLYTEDTYEIEGEPYFGHLRGRFSKQELREVDAYAERFGIEMVPCIQTLAHLNAIFYWEEYRVCRGVRDTGDILCCEEEQTYELIEKMIETFSSVFRSKSIHIGMDEAEMIGRGEYLNRHGYRDRIDIMEPHLKKVLEICRKHGYTSCMMWSDMFFKMFSGGNYYSTEMQISEEMSSRIPDGVELIYWDYYNRDGEKYDKMMASHKKMADQIGFAGGAWKWNTFSPMISHSMIASKLALENCRKHQIENVMVTGWGDDGCECAQASVWPVLSLYAESSYAGKEDNEWLAGRLKACTGADLNTFLQLDCLNLTPDNPSPGIVSVIPEKYMLYQDVMLGIYDRHIDPQTYPAHFSECRKTLAACASQGGEYAYLFETQEKLAAVLEIKADLGIRLKQAYDAKDKAALAAAAEDCLKVMELVEALNQAFKNQWEIENKIFGLEVIQIRFGALKERLKSAHCRINDYLVGKVTNLEELESERRLLDCDKDHGFVTTAFDSYKWAKIVTPSVLSHNL